MPPFSRHKFKTYSRSAQACVINIRCSRSEKSTITSRAKRTGMSTSVYLRALGLHGKIIVAHQAVDAPLIFQLKKIGTNLNQIARKLNATGKHTPLDLVVLCERIDALTSNLMEE